MWICTNHALCQCSFTWDNNILLVNITTFKKKQIYHKEARGEGREHSRTRIPACRPAVTAISDTRLERENSARHPEIPHRCWALGTQNFCWPEIPPSLGWVLTLNLSLAISCDKNLTRTAGGSCGLHVWQGPGTHSLPPKAQGRTAPVPCGPSVALLCLQVQRAKDNVVQLLAHSLEAQPAADVWSKHIQRHEGKSMSHLSQDSDVPCLRDEQSATMAAGTEGKPKAQRENPFPMTESECPHPRPDHHGLPPGSGEGAPPTQSLELEGGRGSPSPTPQRLLTSLAAGIPGSG